MKHAKKHHPKRIQKGLMIHPIDQWTRRTIKGNPDNYKTVWEEKKILVVRERDKKNKLKNVAHVFVGDGEIPGKWKKLWEHLHAHAMEIPKQDG